VQKFWQQATITFIAVISNQMTAWGLATPHSQAPKLRSIVGEASLTENRHTIALHKTTCVRLTFSNSSIVHAGKLWLNDRGMGRMSIKFFNPNLGRPESVDLTMRSENTPEGILLVGSNPIYSGTRNRHPTYSPDNFLLKIDENGRRSLFTFDLNRNTSSVNMTSC
jgi:hypothetical protein